MQKPKWVTVVGVFGIVIGCLGMIGAIQTIMMPVMIKFQSEMFSSMQEIVVEAEKEEQQKKMAEQESGTSSQRSSEESDIPPEEVFNMFNKMWAMPEWFGIWCVTAGIISIILSGFQIFASVWFLQVKKMAVKLFCLAIASLMLFSVVEIIVSASTGSFMGMSMIGGAIFWFVANGSLLIPIATCDKSVFKAAK